jgi:hypothetical protein
MISSSLVPLPATAGEAAPAAALIAEVRKEDFLGFSYGFRPKHSQHDVRRILSFRWPEFD